MHNCRNIHIETKQQIEKKKMFTDWLPHWLAVCVLPPVLPLLPRRAVQRSNPYTSSSLGRAVAIDDPLSLSLPLNPSSPRVLLPINASFAPVSSNPIHSQPDRAGDLQEAILESENTLHSRSVKDSNSDGRALRPKKSDNFRDSSGGVSATGGDPGGIKEGARW
jgi:hypothetical protein